MSQPYHTSSAVLFVIFKRPDFTQRVFDEIRKAQPKRLYVAADGPRADREGEAKFCEESCAIATAIDWDCEVKTLFRQENMGCKDAVSSAITWFFDNEEEGIILEDDCLPCNDFFRFCDAMLERYRYDTRIRHIGGANLQHGQKYGTASYYYSNLTHVWGWAGWRRVWLDYDKTLSRYVVEDVKPRLLQLFGNDMLATDWAEIFTKLRNNQIDTWDYQLTFLNFFNNSLSVIPNVNLITNIGFGVGSTNAHNENDPNANIPFGELGEITHPLYVMPERAADLYTLYKDHHIEDRLRHFNKPNRKLKRWIKGLFKK